MNSPADREDHAWIRSRTEELFEEAGLAVQNRDLPRLSKAHQKLISFYGLLEQLKRIQPESQIHVAPVPESKEPSQFPEEALDENSRERGERVRKQWVLTNASTFTPIRGVLYRDINGDAIGIAYGEEKPGREDTWFLGLPADKFKSAVLLCQPLQGSLFWINLPKDFIAKYNPKFSTSKNGQAKLKVFKHAANYYLQVPVIGNISITEHVNKLP